MRVVSKRDKSKAWMCKKSGHQLELATQKDLCNISRRLVHATEARNIQRPSAHICYSAQLDPESAHGETFSMERGRKTTGNSAPVTRPTTVNVMRSLGVMFM